MKPLKRIITLSTIVTAIILFWLAPNVNRATDKQYTRLYEDTDKHLPIGDTLKNKNSSHQKSNRETKKVYKRESIRTDKPTKLKAQMFSRSIQFIPEKTLKVDSTTEMVDTARGAL